MTEGTAPGPRRIAWRYGLTNMLLVAFLAALIAGGWYIWLAVIVTAMAGSVADEQLGDDHSALSPAGRWFYELNLYATLPLIALITVVFLHYFTAEDPIGMVRLLGSMGIPFAAAPSLSRWGPIIGATVGTGLFYGLAAVTVGHELTHRPSRTGVGASVALLAFTFNTNYLFSHVYNHHRNAGTFKDSQTARRNEFILAFIWRSTCDGWREAFDYEARRLRRLGQSSWSWRNRALRRQLYTLVLPIIAFALAGLGGLAGFLAAAAIGKFLHELVTYLQHYGLVRVEGEPIAARHSWDSYRKMSNTLQYNLPRHADHHQWGAKPFWELKAPSGSPVLPHGYKTMAVIALIPPLWRRKVHPILADWDRRCASEGECRLIEQRGWSIPTHQS